MKKLPFNPFARQAPSQREASRQRIADNAQRWGCDRRTAGNYASAVMNQREGRELSEGERRTINQVRTRHCSNR